jgi:hypothetical protein
MTAVLFRYSPLMVTIPDDITKLLIEQAKQPHSYLVEQMLQCHEDDEEEFIATIKNSVIRDAFLGVLKE